MITSLIHNVVDVQIFCFCSVCTFFPDVAASQRLMLLFVGGGFPPCAFTSAVLMERLHGVLLLCNFIKHH